MYVEKCFVLKAPPLGVMPEYIWKKKRYDELCSAIGRYIIADIGPPTEWLDEGKRLESWLGGEEKHRMDVCGSKGPTGCCPKCDGSNI